MRQRIERAARYQSSALFRDHAKGHVTSHSGNRAPCLRVDRGQEDSPHGLHYRRSPALQPAEGPPPHAQPRRRHQNGHHSRPLITLNWLTPNEDSENLVWEKLADDKNCCVILSEARTPQLPEAPPAQRGVPTMLIFFHAKDA